MATETTDMTQQGVGANGKPRLTNKELNTIWLRWAFTHLASMSYEKLQGHAYAWSYIPFANKYYADDPEAKRRLLVRHSVFFNTEPQTGQIINGIVTSLEENIALGGEVSEEMPNNIKATLMGPLAGIGDSIIQGIIVPTLLSIGMSLANGGSPLGPLFYIVAYGIIGPVISFISYRTGYKLGVGAIDVIVGESARRIMDAFNGAAETESDPGITISTLLSDYGRRSEVGIHNPTLDTISNCVESVAVAENFQINAVAYQNLLIHIAVALVRIQEDCYVPMETERLERMKGQREYQVAEKIADAIDREMNVQLPEEEIAYIAIHLAGKRTMLGAGASEDEGLVISDGVWRVVSEMLDCVWNAFRFDFRNDLELRMNLARHIVPLAVRLRYHMNLKNPLLADIKTRYALAYSMAIDASTVLTRAYDADLSEDEMGYIALAFALALERQKTEAPKKNILVVCASGAGSARLLEYRCRREFADYVDKVMTCDVLGLETFDFSKVDYVFTTVPIHRKLPVPVREVTYFLGDEDVVEMRELLGARGHGPVPSYFKPSLFFPHMTQTSKQDALDFLLDQVCASEPVARNFRELVWKREAMISTSFGNNVAIPHPLEAASSETFICVGLLDHPVAWDTNGQEVQAVFLLGFAAEQDGSLHQFMDTFASVLMDRDAIELLVKRQSWETLAEILAKAQGRQDEAAESDGSSASGA